MNPVEPQKLRESAPSQP